MSTGHRPSRTVRLAVALTTTFAACIAAEGATRLIDGYKLWSPWLTSVRPALGRTPDVGKWVDPRQAAAYVSELPVAQGVDREWYELDPEPRRATPVDPELDRRYWTAGHELPSLYEWNAQFIRATLCTGDSSAHPYLAQQFQRLNDVFVFEPTDGEAYPTYRFLRNAHYPTGLVTNSFGWRGPDLPLNKPRGRIRIAFVGASTTIDAHADPFSYPEYINRWLNRWAEAHRPSVSFDVVNAGREGILSNSIEAIVRQELLPLRPDLVVFYEGANQFWPNTFSARPIVKLLRVMDPRSMLETRSALAVRITSALAGSKAGAEPYKPPISVQWPPNLDEYDPQIGDPRLPVQLPRIVGDFDRIRQTLVGVHGTLMLSSFGWLVYPGLVVDPRRDTLLYKELNERYWPFSYAHMRRFVDFQNRVFRKYAREHDLPFNDLAAAYPRDPRLFVDSIHMTPAGVKLMAWIVFQNLVAELERRLDARSLPLADPGERLVHPAFPETPRKLIPLDQIGKKCRT